MGWLDGVVWLPVTADTSCATTDTCDQCTQRAHCTLSASPGNAMQVGEIMRQKIEQEGWQLIVQGHR